MFLQFAWVQCARFRGEGKRNITDQASIRGPRYFMPVWQRRDGQPKEHRHIDTKSSAYVSMSGVQVSKYAPTVLRAAEAGPAHRADLIAAIGLAQSPTNYRRHVLPLVEAGLLALSLPDKPRSPDQRYLIPESGQQFLAQYGEEDAPPRSE